MKLFNQVLIESAVSPKILNIEDSLLKLSYPQRIQLERVEKLIEEMIQKVGVMLLEMNLNHQLLIKIN